MESIEGRGERGEVKGEREEGRGEREEVRGEREEGRGKRGEVRGERGDGRGNDVGTRRALSAGGRGLVISVFARFSDNARVVPTIPSFAILRARSNRHRI